MSRIANLYIQKSGQDDDVIDISSSNVPGMFKIVFSPNDSKHKYSFFMIQGRVLDYIANILRTLSSDIEPFHYIQVATHTAPSVIYNIGDLAEVENRNDILNSILYALESYPKKNETD